MKALSLRQPWASLMAHGIKRIENRDWPTKYRGQVLIQVSSGWNRTEMEDAWEDVECILEDAGLAAPPFTLADAKAVRGAIIGAMEITDCVTQSDDPFFFGRYGFVVRNPILLPIPIPCRGALGFFDVPADVATAVAPFL